MNKENLERLLRWHRQAYALLMHIDRCATLDPRFLDREALEALSDGERCAGWLQAHCQELASEWLPPQEDRSSFARLFASFFETSFEVAYAELGGELLDARLQKKSSRGRSHTHSTANLVALAVKHVLAGQGVQLDEGQARRLTERPAVRQDAQLVAYVWELDRRARGKGKGVQVHRLWRALPVEQRTELRAEAVLEAMARVSSAAERFVE